MKQIKQLDNYQILFALRVLKAVLGIFVDSFLVLYFLNLSYNNILPLGIYRIVSMFVVFITIFLLRNLSKSKHRVNLLRIAIILDFIYFLSIIFLQEKVIDYIYLIGILYGIEEGFYYSVFSTFESNGVSNSKRTEFIGNFTFVKSLLSIIFPLIFGGLISSTSFLESVAVVLIIVYIRLVLSFEFKDRKYPESEKTDLKNFSNIVKKDNKIRQLYTVNFYYGLTYSKGALQSIIMIYIIKVFSDSMSLGIFTSIFAVLTSLIGLIFSKYLKKKNYPSIIRISMILTIISLIIMIIHCNMLTIIIFNLFQTISTGFVDLINDNSRTNISNLQSFDKKYKVEYFMGVEFSLFIGRMISQTLFILMAFIDVIYIIPIFVIFLLMFMNASIKLQEITND